MISCIDGPTHDCALSISCALYFFRGGFFLTFSLTEWGFSPNTKTFNPLLTGIKGRENRKGLRINQYHGRDRGSRTYAYDKLYQQTVNGAEKVGESVRAF